MEDKGNSLELIETHDALELVPHWEVSGWWLLVVAALFLVLVVAVVLLRRKRLEHDPFRDKRRAYAAAKKELNAIRNLDTREAAVGVSLALRRYLARSLGEPALFETHEEFIGRHEALARLPEGLRAVVSDFFGRLAELKYGPREELPEGGPELVVEGIELLERIHHT